MTQNDISWDEIIKKCPKLYKNGMHFECGPGWQKIILELSLKIEKAINELKAKEVEEIETIYAFQVKEKYGTLRYSMTLSTKEIAHLIEETEAESSQVCEACGDIGKMRGTFWLETKCDKCFKEAK